jgi:hypothetical protein
VTILCCSLFLDGLDLHPFCLNELCFANFHSSAAYVPASLLPLCHSCDMLFYASAHHPNLSSVHLAVYGLSIWTPGRGSATHLSFFLIIFCISKYYLCSACWGTGIPRPDLSSYALTVLQQHRSWLSQHALHVLHAAFSSHFCSIFFRTCTMAYFYYSNSGVSHIYHAPQPSLALFCPYGEFPYLLTVQSLL